MLAVTLAEKREFDAARARLDQLRVANGRFGARYSFLREQDVVLLLCKINLEIGDAKDSLRVLRRELRPDSALLTIAPTVNATNTIATAAITGLLRRANTRSW